MVRHLTKVTGIQSAERDDEGVTLSDLSAESQYVIVYIKRRVTIVTLIASSPRRP